MFGLKRTGILEDVAMFKFLVKVGIVVLALQSGMSFLKKQEILIGDIRINYPVLKEKILSLIPTEKITEKISDVVNSKISEVFSDETASSDKVPSDAAGEGFSDYNNTRIFVHVVTDGETLNGLSERYGIPLQVIKKINNISDENDLTVGQQIKIPARSQNLT